MSISRLNPGQAQVIRVWYTATSKVRPEPVPVLVEIDTVALGRELAEAAARNTGGRAVAACGAIKAKVMIKYSI